MLARQALKQAGFVSAWSPLQVAQGGPRIVTPLLAHSDVRPPLKRHVHSKSVYGRGRAAIQASGAQRKKAAKRSASPQRNKAPAESKGWFGGLFSTAPPPPPRASSDKIRATSLDEENAKLQKLSEKWPAWMDKPSDLRRFEEQRDAKPQQQSSTSSQGQRQPSQGPQVEEGIFIRKDDPAHSSHRVQQQQQQSSGQSRAAKPEPEWPSWLGPRPPPPPPHPIASLFRLKNHEHRKRFWRDNRKILIVVVGIGGSYYVYNLEQVPYTGRWRFNDVSAKQELETAQQSFAQTMAEHKSKILSPNHPYSRATTQVATRLIKAASELHGLDFQQVTQGDQTIDPNDKTYAKESVANTQWQVFVINDPKQKNAFVLPGGQIFVFTGILPFCKDEDGLAAVLGHEISHKLCSHSAEKMAGYKLLIGVSILIDSMLGAAGLGSLAAQWLMQLPNSRRLEEEADALGLRLMSRACFRPEAAAELWKRMDEGDEGGWVGEIFSTHPLSAKRMEKMEKQIPAAQRVRDEAGCPPASATQDFRQATQSFLPRLRTRSHPLGL